MNNTGLDKMIKLLPAKAELNEKLQTYDSNLFIYCSQLIFQ